MLTVRGGSRPRGPGFHDCLVVGFLVGPFFKLIVGDDASGVVGTKDVTPAQVFVLDGVADTVAVVDRPGNLSVRNKLVKFIVSSPTEAISRTVGEPSRMVIRS